MKRSNILFVVAVAVIVLMIGPISAKAAPLVYTLNNVTQALVAGTNSCVSGTCGTYAFGSHGVPNQITWNTGDPAVHGELFHLNWNAPGGHNYIESQDIDFTFHFSHSLTIVVEGTLTETIGPSGSTPTLALSFGPGQGTGSGAISGGKFINITLDPITIQDPSGTVTNSILGSIAVPEPSLAVLLPLGLVFVGGLRKRFLA